MEGVNAGNACYPKSTFGGGLFQSLFFIMLGNNEATKDEKKAASNKSFFKEVCVEARIQNITMCPEYHQGK